MHKVFLRHFTIESTEKNTTFKECALLRTNWLMSKHVQVLQQGPTTCCMWTLLLYAHTCFNF